MFRLALKLSVRFVVGFRVRTGLVCREFYVSSTIIGADCDLGNENNNDDFPPCLLMSVYGISIFVLVAMTCYPSMSHPFILDDKSKVSVVSCYCLSIVHLALVYQYSVCLMTA